MLVARGSLDIAHVKWRWALAFATTFWATLVEQDGIVLDTAFIPAVSEPLRRGRCLFLVMQGSWQSDGTTPSRVEAPFAVLMGEEHLEGASGRRPLTFRVEGHPFAAVELHVAEEDVRLGPSRLPAFFTLRAQTWTCVRAAITTALEGDDEAMIAKMTELAAALADEGVLARRVADAPRERLAFEVLWKALRPMIERFALSPTVDELTGLAGVTARQLERQIRRFVDRFIAMGLFGSGWRSTTRHLRLKLAVMLLSADQITVTQVASAVGYGSTDAMARAFRDAGLRAPVAVQEAMRARHASSKRAAADTH